MGIRGLVRTVRRVVVVDRDEQRLAAMRRHPAGKGLRPGP